jgi:2-keto-3-deoxy-L-rhamnonate aldolase RhmA
LKGLGNREEIAAVEGIVVLAVEANAMTFSLGIHGQFGPLLLAGAMKRVIAACQRHRKTGKCHPHRPARIAGALKDWGRMMMGNSDVSRLR